MKTILCFVNLKLVFTRMDTVKDTLEELNGEVEAEASKYGEDVKHLADFTNSCKKFEPWMAKAETKVCVFKYW